MMQFAVAARIGMTVSRLRHEMDYDEFTHWCAWLTLNPDSPRI